MGQAKNRYLGAKLFIYFRSHAEQKIAFDQFIEQPRPRWSV